jgi:hypothetical protein
LIDRGAEHGPILPAVKRRQIGPTTSKTNTVRRLGNNHWCLSVVRLCSPQVVSGSTLLTTGGQLSVVSGTMTRSSRHTPCAVALLSCKRKPACYTAATTQQADERSNRELDADREDGEANRSEERQNDPRISPRHADTRRNASPEPGNGLTTDHTDLHGRRRPEYRFVDGRRGRRMRRRKTARAKWTSGKNRAVVGQASALAKRTGTATPTIFR